MPNKEIATSFTPEGPWGPFPAGPNLSPIGNLYGWSLVNGADGTEKAGSGNLATTHNATGLYTVKPENTGIPANTGFAIVQCASGANFIVSVIPNIGPQSNWISVASFVSTTGVAIDSDLLVLYFTGTNVPF